MGKSCDAQLRARGAVPRPTRSAPSRLVAGFRVVCAAYFLFLILVVVAADRGALPVSAVVPYDVVLHFVMLGLAALLLHGSLAGAHWHRLPVGPSLVAAGATLEELSQRFVETRTFSLADLSANLAGVVVAYLVYESVKRLRSAPAS